MRAIASVVLAASLATACGGSSTGPGASDQSGSTSTGSSSSMAATVGASSWHGTKVIAVKSADGTIGISGSDASTFNVGFRVKGTATGSYAIPDCTGPGGIDTGTNEASVVDWAGTSAWLADCSHTGTVRITSITSDGVSGTFNFELAPSSGTAAKSGLSVSSGTFSVTF